MQFARSVWDAGRNRTSLLVLTKRESPYPFLQEQRSPSHCASLCRNVTDAVMEICHFLTQSSTNLPSSMIATECFPLARHSSLSLRFLTALAAQGRSMTLQLQQIAWKIWSYSALEDASVNFFVPRVRTKAILFELCILGTGKISLRVCIAGDWKKWVLWLMYLGAFWAHRCNFFLLVVINLPIVGLWSWFKTNEVSSGKPGLIFLVAYRYNWGSQ